MLETLLSLGKGSSGGFDDGQPTITVGTTDAGYYGQVLASKLIDGDTLASALGLVAGNSINATSNWLKFSYKGKPLYVAKMPLRDNITWQEIYQSGAVYGDDTNGNFPSGANRLQNARVVIKNTTFRVRLMRMADADPTQVNVRMGGEAFALWMPIRASTPAWASFSDDDLGQSTTSSLTHGMESNITTTSQMLLMNTTLNVTNDNKTQRNVSNVHFMWRPVLEPV